MTIRGVYLSTTAGSKVPDLALNDSAKLSAYGVAMNLDLDKWFILSEVTQLERKFEASAYSYKAPAMTFALVRILANGRRSSITRNIKSQAATPANMRRSHLSAGPSL